jgi:DNA mismatch endonuclease (patch repair protein)
MDNETSAQRSKQMSRIRSKHTEPELLVRRLVHGMGYRYRLHRRDLPGSPDLVFPSRHKVILVHGCFWHRHPDPSCPLTRTPKSRLDFWIPKFEANRQRDLKTKAQLEALGWGIMVVWECQLRHVESIEARVREFLGR